MTAQQQIDRITMMVKQFDVKSMNCTLFHFLENPKFRLPTMNINLSKTCGQLRRLHNLKDCENSLLLNHLEKLIEELADNQLVVYHWIAVATFLDNYCIYLLELNNEGHNAENDFTELVTHLQKIRDAIDFSCSIELENF